MRLFFGELIKAKVTVNCEKTNNRPDKKSLFLYAKIDFQCRVWNQWLFVV